jgi:hypothetical protein
VEVGAAVAAEVHAPALVHVQDAPAPVQVVDVNHHVNQIIPELAAF